MMGKKSRTKGLDFERWVAKRMREKFPEAKRGLQSREGDEAPDVDGTPWFIECKRYAKKVDLGAAMAQVLAAKDQRPAIVVWRVDHGKPQVSVPMDPTADMLLPISLDWYTAGSWQPFYGGYTFIVTVPFEDWFAQL